MVYVLLNLWSSSHWLHKLYHRIQQMVMMSLTTVCWCCCAFWQAKTMPRKNQTEEKNIQWWKLFAHLTSGCCLWSWCVPWGQEQQPWITWAKLGCLWVTHKSKSTLLSHYWTSGTVLVGLEEDLFQSCSSIPKTYRDHFPWHYLWWASLLTRLFVYVSMYVSLPISSKRWNHQALRW